MVGCCVQGCWGDGKGACSFWIWHVSDSTWNCRPTVHSACQDNVTFPNLRMLCRPGSLAWPCSPRCLSLSISWYVFFTRFTHLPASLLFQNHWYPGWWRRRSLTSSARGSYCGGGGPSESSLTWVVPCDLQAGITLLTSPQAAGGRAADLTTSFLLASLLVCVGQEGGSSCILGCPGDMDRRESLKVAGRPDFSLLSLLLQKQLPWSGLAQTATECQHTHFLSPSCWNHCTLKTQKPTCCSHLLMCRIFMKHSQNRCDEFVLIFWVAEAQCPEQVFCQGHRSQGPYQVCVRLAEELQPPRSERQSLSFCHCSARSLFALLEACGSKGGDLCLPCCQRVISL